MRGLVPDKSRAIFRDSRWEKKKGHRHNPVGLIVMGMQRSRLVASFSWEEGDGILSHWYEWGAPVLEKTLRH